MDKSPPAMSFDDATVAATVPALSVSLSDGNTLKAGIPGATIALEADDEALMARIFERGKSSGRADDQDESMIRIRFGEYNQKTAPLKAYYQRQGKFHSVNGVGAIDEITRRLGKIIDGLIKN